MCALEFIIIRFGPCASSMEAHHHYHHHLDMVIQCLTTLDGTEPKQCSVYSRRISILKFRWHLQVRKMSRPHQYHQQNFHQHRSLPKDNDEDE